MAKVDIEEWTAKARLDWYSPGSNVDFESAKRRHRENLKALRLAQEEREEDGRPIHVLVLHGSGRHEMLSCAREASNSQMFLDRCLDVALEEWSGEREVRVRRHVLRELYMNPCNACIPEDELVLTADGWVRMGDTKTEFVVDGRGEPHLPSRTFDKGKQPVYRVRTIQGLEVTATPDHEVYLHDGSKREVRDLRPGDQLAVYVPDEPLLRDRPLSDADVPWGLEFGELLGALVGDGTFKRYGKARAFKVSLSKGRRDRDIVERGLQILKKLFGTNAAVRDYVVRPAGSARKELNGYTLKTSLMSRFSTSNAAFGEAAEALGLEKHRVPEAIFTADGETIRGFLRGLFSTDGGVTNSDRRYSFVTFSSEHPTLLRDVQRLLLQFGIWSTTSGRMLYIYGIDDVHLFMEHIGFFSARRNREAKLTERTGPTREHAAVVKCIEPCGYEHVLDIEMPQDHSFFAGGIRVSNCYSTASALCGFSCTCFPQDDISTALYPDIMWADVLLFSTPINQAGCSTRLKTVLDRLISLDGGYAEKELPVKNEEYREQAIALSQKKPVYDKRMFGRVAAYFISSKDMNNEHEEAVETPEEFAHLSYADLTVGQLAVQGAEYGWFHAKPFWAAWAADPDQEMSFDKAHLDAFLPLDEGVEVILAALKKADYLHRNPPRLEAPGRYNRT